MTFSRVRGIFSPELQLSIMHKFPSLASVFTAEAWAILYSTLIINKSKITNSVILTDSMSVLDALSTRKKNDIDYVIHRIKSELHTAKNGGREIKFVWIPSHRGIHGNEAADSLAKEAILSGTEIPNFKIPHRDLFAISKKLLIERSLASLGEAFRFKSIHYATHYLPLISKLWYFKKRLKRLEITTL